MIIGLVAVNGKQTAVVSLSHLRYTEPGNVMKPKNILPIMGLALLLVSLPYVVAAVSAAPGMPFGGFLLNPLDGNSYLAKMREG
ncbi:MAG: hypothetical protein ABFD44_02140, partial [Anaerolineaceae bacterium]